jgi:fumarate hydratase class II
MTDETPITFPADHAGFLAQVAEDLERLAEEVETLAAIVGGRAVRMENEEEAG